MKWWAVAKFLRVWLNKAGFICNGVIIKHILTRTKFSRLKILQTFNELCLSCYCWLEMDNCLAHWGQVTHICIGKLTIIGSDNGLWPGRRQTIIWTNAGILFFGPLRSNFSEILIKIDTFLFKKIHLKLPSAKWRPFCLGLNVLIIFHKNMKS